MKIKKVLTLLSILSLSLVTGCDPSDKSENNKHSSSSSIDSSINSNEETSSSEPYYPVIEKKEYN